MHVCTLPHTTPPPPPPPTTPATLAQAVYTTLREAEYRSTYPIAYWNFPPLRWLVPRQRRNDEALAVISDTLDELIAKCKKLVGGRVAGRGHAGAGFGPGGAGRAGWQHGWPAACRAGGAPCAPS